MSRHSSLPSDSYTARRLEHATPEHLHQTSLRTFVGPIPQGWLRSHRKAWYSHYIKGDRKRVPTFTAADDVPAVPNGHTDPASSSLRPNEAEEIPRPSSQSGDGAALRSPVASDTSLLRSHHEGDTATSPATTEGQRSSQPPTHAYEDPAQRPRFDPVASKLPIQKVRFNESSRLQMRARAQRLAAKGSFRSPKIKDGEMMKVDKMLVRIDITQQSLKDDYDERTSQAVETKTMDKWREFMVVARKHKEGDAEAVLQLYKTRFIAVSEQGKVKRKPKAQIFLSSAMAKVNLYSALDKTLCVWTTTSMRTTIYYLRAPSGAAAVDWYTFLGGLLGYDSARTLQVNVPDLSVSLRIADPFKSLGQSETMAAAADGNDDALAQAVSDESGAAGAIVTKCLDMLKQSPEWSAILQAWTQYDRIGLAWKRYDRLEWVHGAVEQRMYGTIAMQRTHDLELRPKHHYPQKTKTPGGEALKEPAPIEGFLIRLTSQKGQERRLGKMLFKRLYFTTQNEYLLSVRPARATPPPPPSMLARSGTAVPSADDFANKVPLTFDIDPYPLEDQHIAWLDNSGVKSQKVLECRDRAASDEAERNSNMILASEGFINLCDVCKVRPFTRGATAADEHLEEGSNVDFHRAVPDTRREDGSTGEIQEERVVELVMKNGLVIRLQSYNKTTRDVWLDRLGLLVTYWTHRRNADMTLYKTTREQNLRALRIDERAEAVVGQFAYKWEVGASFASPQLYHMCGIATCRPLHLSGTLFRKPRRHTTFTRCHVLLAHSHVLIFQDSLRSRASGRKLVHTHHERVAAINLHGCYLYSGLLSERDLLYQNRTFDSNAPGHHALPRVYLDDAWTSTDEDAMTTFVIWHAKSRAWFRSSRSVDDAKDAGSGGEAEGGKRAAAKTHLTRVSQLGATGRSVVFKARSRAERDHWVLALQVEIEKAAERERNNDEEVRIVDEEEGQ